MNKLNVQQLTPEALPALVDAIAHWKRMAKDGIKSKDRPLQSECALCSLFWNQKCRGCPVSIKTGEYCCNDTPFHDAFRHFVSGYNPGFKRAAAKEVAFLESLLPEGKEVTPSMNGGTAR